MNTVDLNGQSSELLTKIAEKRSTKGDTKEVRDHNIISALIAEAYRIEVNDNLTIIYISDDEAEEHRAVIRHNEGMRSDELIERQAELSTIDVQIQEKTKQLSEINININKKPSD